MKTIIFLCMTSLTFSAHANLLGSIFSCTIKPREGFPYSAVVTVNEKNRIYYEVKGKKIIRDITCGNEIDIIKDGEGTVTGDVVLTLGKGNCSSTEHFMPLDDGYAKISDMEQTPYAYIYMIKNQQPFYCKITQIDKKKLKHASKKD